MQQDVFRLDVAMNDPMAMGVIERSRHLGRDAHRFGNRKLFLAVQPVAQRLALDERHRVPQQPVNLARIYQAQDVRVLQVGGGLDLFQKPFRTDHRRELRPQHFHCDLAIVFEVVREIHRGHPARAELALDAVAVAQGGGQP
jgi:hypothetical protein